MRTIATVRTVQALEPSAREVVPPYEEVALRVLFGALVVLAVRLSSPAPWWMLSAFAVAFLAWTSVLYWLARRALPWANGLAASGDGIALGLSVGVAGFSPVLLSLIALVVFAHGLRLGWRGSLLAAVPPTLGLASIAFRQGVDMLLAPAFAVLVVGAAGLSAALLARPRPAPTLKASPEAPAWEEIAAALAPVLAGSDLVTLAREAALATRRLTGAAGCVVGYVDRERAEILLSAEGTWPAEPLSGRSLGARALATGAPQRSRSGVGVAGLPPWALGLPTRDFWAVPLIVNGEGIGVLYFWDEEETPSLASDLAWFLPAVGLVAVALRNARRLQQMDGEQIAPKRETVPAYPLGGQEPAAEFAPFAPRDGERSLSSDRRRARDEFLVGELRVEGARSQVSLRGRSVACSPLEFELLYALAEQAGRTLSQTELLRRVWGEGYAGSVGVVEVTIHRLRRRLEDGRHSPARILTVRGEGYMLVDPRHLPYAAFRTGLAAGP